MYLMMYYIIDVWMFFSWTELNLYNLNWIFVSEGKSFYSKNFWINSNDFFFITKNLVKDQLRKLNQ